jgi:two-component sensor histidine kinase
LGGTVQDITKRKEREEKENLLMREINHRAKNMLSVVDAISHQTATTRRRAGCTPMSASITATARGSLPGIARLRSLLRHHQFEG